MDVHDTRLLMDVQYLAPLMAYFDSRLGAESKVLTLDDGEFEDSNIFVVVVTVAISLILYFKHWIAYTRS